MEDIKIKEVSIRENRKIITLLMQGLQQSEKELFDKTASWNDIEENYLYLHHLMTMEEECDGTCLVAYDRHAAVGFIFGYIVEPDESQIEINTGKELYVSDGYVLPEYRKRGIYKKINSLIEQKYIQQGIRRITRFTLVNNEPMRNFLLKGGYKPTRILFEKWL